MLFMNFFQYCHTAGTKPFMPLSNQNTSSWPIVYPQSIQLSGTSCRFLLPVPHIKMLFQCQSPMSIFSLIFLLIYHQCKVVGKINGWDLVVAECNQLCMKYPVPLHLGNPLVSNQSPFLGISHHFTCSHPILCIVSSSEIPS